MVIKLSYKGQNKRIAKLKKYENIMLIGFNLNIFQASSMSFAVAVSFDVNGVREGEGAITHIAKSSMTILVTHNENQLTESCSVTKTCNGLLLL